MMSFADTFVSGLQGGEGFGKSLAAASASAAAAYAGSYIGGEIGGAALGKYGGAFGASVGGSMGGEMAYAAVMGQDIGTAALAGAASGATMLPVVSSGVSSVIHGGSFKEGAIEGAWGAAGSTAVYVSGQIASGNWTGAQDAAKDDSGGGSALITQEVSKEIAKKYSGDESSVLRRVPASENNNIGTKFRQGFPYTGTSWIIDVALLGAGGKLLAAPHPYAKAIGALMVIAGAIGGAVSIYRAANSVEEGTEAVGRSWINRNREEWLEINGH